MYTVPAQDGTILMQSAMDFRYSPETELSLLNSGHVLKLNGKRITKKEVQERAESNQRHGPHRARP